MISSEDAGLVSAVSVTERKTKLWLTLSEPESNWVGNILQYFAPTVIWASLMISFLSINYYSLSPWLVTICRQNEVTFTVTEGLISPERCINNCFTFSFKLQNVFLSNMSKKKRKKKSQVMMTLALKSWMSDLQCEI